MGAIGCVQPPYYSAAHEYSNLFFPLKIHLLSMFISILQISFPDIQKTLLNNEATWCLISEKSFRGWGGIETIMLLGCVVMMHNGMTIVWTVWHCLQWASPDDLRYTSPKDCLLCGYSLLMVFNRDLCWLHQRHLFKNTCLTVSQYTDCITDGRLP